jgi:hypothetical protein
MEDYPSELKDLLTPLVFCSGSPSVHSLIQKGMTTKKDIFGKEVPIINFRFFEGTGSMVIPERKKPARVSYEVYIPDP